MPTYEYTCEKCGGVTEVVASFREKEKGLKIRCSKCGSKKMTQVFGNFYIAGVSKGSDSKTCTRKTCPPSCSACR